MAYASQTASAAAKSMVANQVAVAVHRFFLSQPRSVALLIHVVAAE